jgi:hypothetical protein
MTGFKTLAAALTVGALIARSALADPRAHLSISCLFVVRLIKLTLVLSTRPRGRILFHHL